MTRVLYNGEYIELKDELEPGELELDLNTYDEDSSVNLEDTIKMDYNEINLQSGGDEHSSTDLEDTIEIDYNEINLRNECDEYE